MSILEFKAFLEEYDFSEVFDMKHKVDGHWIQKPNAHSFVFSLPGEDQCYGPGGQQPCWSADFAGNPESAVEVSFAHATTKYDDRDMGRANATIIGTAVIQALQEYITKFNPAMLHWGAAQKTREKTADTTNNDKARQKIYALWFKKNMFPSRYVPIPKIAETDFDDSSMDSNPQMWVRRDLYDSNYVPKGYPQVPQGNGSRVYKQFIDSLHSNVNNLNQQAQNARQQQAAQQQAAAEQAIGDPRYNPQRLGNWETVMDMNPAASGGMMYQSTYGHIGKITGFSMSNDGQLMAHVSWEQDKEGNPADSNSLSPTVPVSHLKRVNKNKQVRRARNIMQQQAQQPQQAAPAPAAPAQSWPDGAQPLGVH